MRILIVGREGTEIGAARDMALAQGATVRHVPTPDRALTQLRDGLGADLLLLDASEDITGTIRRLAGERIHLPIVAYGIGTDAATAVAAIKAGAQEFLPLPPDAELIAAILETLGEDPSDLVFEDPATRDLLQFARQVAPSDASVLITGESGTGKEMVARYVHRCSRRADQIFVSLNCAAIPEALLESELFGHEKGAFTGALARRIGKFEEADGGTLLLDEISEMEPRLQAKLLRAIQEREIDRLGGQRPVRVDIRLIATSNRDLELEVAAGRFREDLFFRLNVVNLRLPPLRARPGDIAPLARHFAAKYARANGLPHRELSEAALARLRQAPWKGNVRELENCLHRAVLVASGPTIEAEAIRLGPPRHGPAEPAERGRFGQTVAEVERDLILETLQHTLGNRTHAAKILGISIRTLRNKLRQYGDEGIAVPPPPVGPLPALSEST
jgi:DNA-binding NtrC family response regulator